MKCFGLFLFFMVILVVGSISTENNCDDGQNMILIIVLTIK